MFATHRRTSGHFNLTIAERPPFTRRVKLTPMPRRAIE